MAGKKRQIVIPQTSTLYFIGMNKKALRDWCKTYYGCHFIGKKVVNLDLGIEISFKRLGKKKSTYGAAMMVNFITAWMNVASNTKRAGKNPAR